MFYLLDGPLAGMPVTVTDWKRCLYIFLNGKTGKLHFTNIEYIYIGLQAVRMWEVGMPKTHEFLQNIDCWEIYIYTWLRRQLYPTTHVFPQGSLVFSWKHTYLVCI